MSVAGDADADIPIAGVPNAEVSVADIPDADVGVASISEADVCVANVVVADVADAHISAAQVPASQLGQHVLQLLLQTLLNRRQLRGHRRRGGVIAEHRGHVLGPYLLVFSLRGRDRRGVLAQQVGCHQRRQPCPVGRDHRWRHGGRQRRLERARR